MAGLLSRSCGKETTSPACQPPLAQLVHVGVTGARKQIAGAGAGGALVLLGAVGVAPSPLVAIALPSCE